MNTARCLSLVSNALRYGKTRRIADIVDQLRQHGEEIDEETFAPISVLPFKHVLPHGSYFNDD